MTQQIDLCASAGARALSGRQAQAMLAERPEEERLPDFPIVDSHVHIYDPANLPYHWLKNAPAINQAYLPDDFTRLTHPVAIDKYVFVEVDVEVGRHVDEARWVSDVAKSDARLGGIVASVPIERGRAIEADLAALAKLPLVKG